MASPFLSSALMMARDGITGFWEAHPSQMANPTLPRDDAYLQQLRKPSQALMLDTCMKAHFKGDGQDGHCKFSVDGQDVLFIERPGIDYFKDQMSWLRAYADLRTDRIPEIYEQLDDMMSFFGAISFLDSGRRAYSLMLLSSARWAAIHVETPFKFYCRSPRPVDYAPEVQPIIQTPDHSAYPSGHATEAFAIATVMHRLMTGDGPEHGIQQQALPFKMAQRIAANRTVAGVHFPVDSRAGALLGCMVGEAIYRLAHGGHLQGAALTRKTLDEEWNQGQNPTPDFLLSDFTDLDTRSDPVTINIDTVVKFIWDKAQPEWPSLVHV